MPLKGADDNGLVSLPETTADVVSCCDRCLLSEPLPEENYVNAFAPPSSFANDYHSRGYLTRKQSVNR